PRRRRRAPPPLHDAPSRAPAVPAAASRSPASSRTARIAAGRGASASLRISLEHETRILPRDLTVAFSPSAPNYPGRQQEVEADGRQAAGRPDVGRGHRDAGARRAPAAALLRTNRSPCLLAAAGGYLRDRAGPVDRHRAAGRSRGGAHRRAARPLAG